MKAFLLLLALATFSAAQQVPHWSLPTHLRVFASPVFSAKDRAEINSAIESWRHLLPEGITMQYASETDAVQTCNGCITIVRDISLSSRELGECELNHHDRTTDYVIIRVDPKAGKSVFEHELGHAIGLSHYRDSIMSEKVSHYHPNNDDAARLRLIYPDPNQAITESCCALDATVSLNPSPVQRYAFQRVVIVSEGPKTVTRCSTFTFDDRGEQIETDIAQAGRLEGIDEKYWRHFPAFPIGRDVTAEWARGSAALKAFTVVWRNELGNSNGLPWFADGEKPSGLAFPVEAIKVDGPRKVFVQLYNYRSFRVSVAIKELEF